MNIESQLKDVFRRTAPPPGFASRVLARIEADRAGASLRRRWMTRALAAAALMAAMIGGWAVHLTERRRAEQGEHARQQVLVAMRIVGSKVAYAQREVRALGSRRVEQ